MKDPRINLHKAKTPLSELPTPATEQSPRLDTLKDDWKDLDLDLDTIASGLIGEDSEIVALFEGENQ